MLALPVGITVLGVSLLRAAWQRSRSAPPARLALNLAGWMLLAGSLPLWMQVSGPDRGAWIALLMFMLVGLGWIVHAGWASVRVTARDRRRRDERAPREAVEDRGSTRQRIWTFLLAGPLAAGASLAFGLALHLGLLALDVHPANALAVVLLSVPIVWTVLAVLATTLPSLRSRFGIIGSLMIVGLVASWMLPGAGS